MHKLTLRFPWKMKNDHKVSYEIIQINALHNISHYGRFIGGLPSEGFAVGTNKSDALNLAFSALSQIKFMDLTGLRKSRAHYKIWGNDFVPPSAFDHTRCWTAGRSKYIVTTEPYGGKLDEAVNWCKTKDWSYHVFKPGIGFWNPGGGTILIITSPLKYKVDIPPIVKIMEHMPNINNWERWRNS